MLKQKRCRTVLASLAVVGLYGGLIPATSAALSGSCGAVFVLPHHYVLGIMMCDQVITLAELSHVAGLSRFHLIRAFVRNGNATAPLPDLGARRARPGAVEARPEDCPGGRHDGIFGPESSHALLSGYLGHYPGTLLEAPGPDGCLSAVRVATGRVRPGPLWAPLRAGPSHGGRRGWQREPAA